MDATRIIFAEEGDGGSRIEVGLAGVINDDLLNAVANFIDRQRSRLWRNRPPVEPADLPIAIPPPPDEGPL